MPLYPTKYLAATVTSHDLHDKTDITVVASNAISAVTHNMHHANALTISPALAVANMGATSVNLTKGALRSNKQIATNPIS